MYGTSSSVAITERLWSVSEAAKLLGVMTKTIYRHVRDGSLRTLRVGPRLLRIPHQELVIFLKANSVGGAE